jgi:two-component system sensor histidine kinase UhpB
VGRTLRPFPAIVGALERMQGGDYATRLPALRGREAGMIGAAVNRMAASVQEHMQAKLRAYEAERQLSETRELAHRIEQHMEAERRAIARELHDELGQSVTAIRSLALSLTQRRGGTDAADTQGRDAAQLIADEAARLYDAMHGLIPRLTPLALDSLGLGDALADLVGGTRQRHAGIEIDFALEPIGVALDAAVALAAYRVAQESLNNALRHSGASRIDITLRVHDGRLELQVRDHGRGLPDDWQRPGHYGLIGLRERVLALGGTLDVARHPAGGTQVRARLPIGAASPAAHGGAT